MEETINRRSQAAQLPSIWTIGCTFIVVVLLFGSIETMAACPHLCECKWKSGKESVLCLNANLSAIPTKLDAGTQILDLSRNDIQAISNDVFSRANLLNLQKLFLTKCHLKTIERFAFRKLNNLVELDLSDNLLGMIPSHAFESVSELRELKLIGNPIQRIHNDAFVKVAQLVRLELSNCLLTTIDVRAFTGLETSLEWLKLDSNKLTEIRVAAVISLQNLHGLELAGNPWNCSCTLRPLREWMLRENIPYNIPPMCQYPERLHSKTWDKIDLDEYACKPSIFSAIDRFHAVEGRNVTLSCAVGGIPEPHVRWMIRNRVIANLTGNTNLASTSTTTTTSAQGRKLYKYQQNASNLTILTADIQDQGTYVCIGENKAGKVEVSLTLAVSKKPSETILSTKVILASVIAFVFFVIATVLLVIGVCTLKRRKKLGRWNTQGRTDSYEKIELSNKPNYNVSKSPRGDRTAFMKMYAENGIAVVGGHVRRNGDYRNVPSEDDGTDGLEDNTAESNNATISNIKIDDVRNWNPTTVATSVSRSAKNDIISNQTDGVNMKPLQLTDSDLHIPRLIELSDSATDSSIDLYDGKVSKRGKANAAWSHHIAKRERISTMASAGYEKNYGREKVYQSGSEGRVCESDCDIDKKYPDLLDISRMSMQTSVATSSRAQLYTQTSIGSSSNTTSNNNKSAPSNPFCTFPRKKHISSRKPTPSESQSPLLTDSSSQYGSSTFADSDLFGRRLSSESFGNYPLSICTRNNQSSNNGRSNSFLNLTTQSNSGKPQTANYMSHKRNPSLPSSPCKEPSLKLVVGGDETPLLDFSSFAMHKQQMIITPSSSTSNTTAPATNAYDYHAAQLERFLEEYRNLQEQLCKMKETCESIRKKEAPLRATAGNSVKVADPVMFEYSNNPSVSGALSFDGGGGGGGGGVGVGGPPNPKGILKNKMLLKGPNQPPDPPPYWLHRNAMLKRLQDPSSDFFPS
ncbi:uncharacterized protein LOC129566638 [Sitodiplosis mosellana]|uniref:uncharacterized protein LOC129566638 n=1 Tax=Sitodiplosis mosellana TaxID=263140 RepID=UPI002443AEBC|nr:uncharacterized protein LOC129566638 [Sitodiplosis mosellana]XP_055298704.1 uncharacterized protein LOC129566638 [Sitodiplosis mosellana]